MLQLIWRMKWWMMNVVKWMMKNFPNQWGMKYDWQKIRIIRWWLNNVQSVRSAEWNRCVMYPEPAWIPCTLIMILSPTLVCFQTVGFSVPSHMFSTQYFAVMNMVTEFWPTTTANSVSCAKMDIDKICQTTLINSTWNRFTIPNPASSVLISALGYPRDPYKLIYQ